MRVGRVLIGREKAKGAGLDHGDSAEVQGISIRRGEDLLRAPPGDIRVRK